MLLLSRSLRRKLLATVLSAIAFLLLYQATVHDSRNAASASESAAYVAPQPGARMTFQATAYCKGLTTASGVNVRAGIAAADPKVLPIGSVVQVSGVPEAHRGIYTVLDTGPEVQGRARLEPGQLRSHPSIIRPSVGCCGASLRPIRLESRPS
jgi:3D (Asp-Asp-Asp) domain-containing protein